MVWSLPHFTVNVYLYSQTWLYGHLGRTATPQLRSLLLSPMSDLNSEVSLYNVLSVSVILHGNKHFISAHYRGHQNQMTFATKSHQLNAVVTGCGFLKTFFIVKF